MAANYFSYNREDSAELHTFVKAKETVRQKSLQVPCSSEHLKEKHSFPSEISSSEMKISTRVCHSVDALLFLLLPGCLSDQCGRFVMDKVVSKDEAMHMLRFEDFQCPYSLMICLVSAALLRLD
jgi:hypothetical protein